MSDCKSVAEVSFEVLKALTSRSSGIVTFSFKLPEDGLALRSVGIVDGVPELRFDASPKVPTISEQDVAVAFRLAEEDERPYFLYASFPCTHPLNGSRYFMKYSPAWLKGTGIGKLLAEADWIMKCLHVDTRTNKEKTVFKSWSKTSQLQGLAANLDFPKDDTCGPVMMSCDHAKVQKSDDEIYFPEEPSMKITDGCNSLYSKYITEIYRSVGYHDEPLLLKMQELIKLILAVEWLYKEKGVRVDENWMMNLTCNPKDPEFSERKAPPYDMIPHVDVFERPCSDVTVKTWEAEMYKRLKTEYGVDRRFGYHNFTGEEIVQFNEDGTTATRIPLKCMKICIEQNSSIQHQLIMKFSLQLYLPLAITSEATESRLELHDHSHKLDTSLIPISVDSTLDFNAEGNGMKLKIVESFQPCPPFSSPPLKQTTVGRGTVCSYGKVFANEDPSQPFLIPAWQEDEIDPKVESWNELISEWSVPIPRIWQDPFVGVGVPAAFGGVTTEQFRVEEELFQRRATSTVRSSKGNYALKGQQLVVKSTSQGAIQLVNSAQVSSMFSARWKKGLAPRVRSIFAITNPTLESKWQLYGSNLHNKQCERYYHGTSLTCDITTSQALCKDGNCGICGISCSGLDPKQIGKHISFQRFGRGFYLAPNSSKCHDYTRSVNGLRAMLLCDVYPGRKYNLMTNDQKLTSPPRGYDSVYGKVGGDLNYPELVVYNPDAVMPRYIVVYDKI